MDQFIVGCIVDNINNSCFACTFGGSGEVAHVRPHGMVVFAASLHEDCVYAVGANLSVGSRVSSLVALVPVVLRETYGSVPPIIGPFLGVGIYPGSKQNK